MGEQNSVDGGQNEGKGVVEGSIWGRGQWTWLSMPPSPDRTLLEEMRDWVTHTHTHTSSCLSLKPVKQMTVFSMVQE